MKEQILKLRESGHSYRAIQAQLKCCLISYYCGEEQKEKTKTIEEFLNFCQRILEYNGYTVTK